VRSSIQGSIQSFVQGFVQDFVQYYASVTELFRGYSSGGIIRFVNLQLYPPMITVYSLNHNTLTSL